jgi:Flp pilus assembly protein CpaB
MKGVQGIIIAVGLGLAGAACNWFYIAGQARDFQKMAFVVVDPDARINLGDRFKTEHFARVDIPRPNVGSLEKTAVQWQDLETVVGMTATRSYFGGEIVLRQDLKTPAQRDLSELLREDEVSRWVPVDPRTFVPEHLNPGDRVSFVMPQFNTQAQAGSLDAGNNAGATQTIGPFEVLALGTRKGRREVLQAKGDSPAKESLVSIRVKLLKDGGYEPRAQRLFDVLRLTNYQGVQVMLHSSRMAQEP